MISILLFLLSLMDAQLLAERSIIYTWGVSESPFPNGIHVEYCGEFCGKSYIAAAQIGPYKGYCWLWISDAWLNSDHFQQRYIIDHEVGHCLGIPGHGDFFGESHPSLMNQSAGVSKPTDWDFTMLRYYLPLKYSTRVPNIGGD